MDVALTNPRGPMLTPAWPERVPEDQFDQLPKDAKRASRRRIQALVAEKCTVCHDVQRILGKRSDVDRLDIHRQAHAGEHGRRVAAGYHRSGREQHRQIHVGEFPTAAGRRRCQWPFAGLRDDRPEHEISRR